MRFSPRIDKLAFNACSHISIGNDLVTPTKVISFGFGLPMKRTGAFLNLSAEFGERGTTDENLIQND